MSRYTDGDNKRNTQPPQGNRGGRYNEPPRRHDDGGRYEERLHRNDDGRRYREEPRRKKGGSVIGNIISTLVLLIAIGVFCFAGWKLYGYYRDYKAGTDEYSALNDQYVIDPNTSGNGDQSEGSTEAPGEILKTVTELENPETVQTKRDNAAKAEVVENQTQQQLPKLVNPINFTDLKAINEEIIGWIRIGALDLSYPVAQAADNDFYLHRTFEKADNFAGCIFLNCDNTRYLTDQNSIVYGHNMKNGSMFGSLKKFKDQELYDSNPYFWIFTPQFLYQYRIFSVETVSSMGDPYITRFTTDKFQEFIEECQSKSEVDNHGVEVTTNDRIVTLSTCTGDTSTRLIVQGRLEQVYASVDGSGSLTE